MITDVEERAERAVPAVQCDQCAGVEDEGSHARTSLSSPKQDGTSGPLEPEQIMVVAPYNAQMRCLREALPAGVRVGTVDKFQGQEAAGCLFSMATSNGEEVPRNLEFLFS